MEEAREIDSDHCGEVGFGVPGEGLCNEHARIIDERIDPPVTLDGSFHDAIGGLFTRDVTIDR